MTAGAKKTILGLHGAGMHGAVWGGLLPHLDEHYHVLSDTLPGHRQDKTAPLLHSIADMAAHYRSHLAGEPPASIVLMGHSMGALIALELADEPAVAALVLMGAGAEMPVDAGLLDTAKKDPAAANAVIAKAGVAKSPSAAAIIDMVASLQNAADPAAIHADLSACNDYKNGVAKAATIAKPALVISGDADRLAPVTAGHDLADLLQYGEFVILENCGHMMMLEQPLETARQIRDFLSRHNI